MGLIITATAKRKNIGLSGPKRAVVLRKLIA
jgi:hypothetical protein